jgi:hypothetical protein
MLAFKPELEYHLKQTQDLTILDSGIVLLLFLHGFGAA